jgi:hypothetical protein
MWLTKFTFSECNTMSLSYIVLLRYNYKIDGLDLLQYFLFCLWAHSGENFLI